MEWRLRSDVRGKEDGYGEGDDGIDVHGKLEGREMEAGEEGEKAVEAGRFV